MINLFFSPHPDDIALSCCYAVNQVNRKVLVTVFTRSQYAPFADNNEVFKISRIRKNEDLMFAKFTDSSYIPLPFSDTSITIQEKYLAFSEFVHPQEDEISKVINDLLSRYKTANVYIPLAFGIHNDHILVRNLVYNFFISKFSRKQLGRLFFYEDLPYCFQYDYSEIEFYFRSLDIEIKLKNIHSYTYNISTLWSKKRQGCNFYKSQGIIDIWKSIEEYSSTLDINNEYSERYWQILFDHEDKKI